MGHSGSEIEAQGKQIVDVTFHGQTNEVPIPASIKVAVSDVARNVASMGRLLRAGLDLHFTNHGHTCWMENGGLKTTVSEDGPASEAPLYSLDVEVLPPPGEFSNGKTTVGAWVAPIASEDERLEEGSRVVLAGLVRDMGLQGQRGICVGRAPDGEMADRLAGRQTCQREDVEHQTFLVALDTWHFQLSPVLSQKKNNLTHLPAAA